MKPDPFPSQKPGDPQSWNLFPYVRNNPLIYVDPKGTQRSEMSDDRRAIAEKRRKDAERDRTRRRQSELELSESLGAKPFHGAVKIFYWAPQILPDNENASALRVGHLSMMLPDGTYISLFPEGAHASYKVDVLAEGGNATQIYELDGLPYTDQKILKEWWAGEAKDNYKALKNNCADVVRSALLMGGLGVENGQGLGGVMGASIPGPIVFPFSTPGNTLDQIALAVSTQQKSKRGDMRSLNLRRTR